MAIATTTTTHLGEHFAAGQVALSFILATIGSFAALASATRVRTATGIRRLAWIGCVAVAFGCGAVWSTYVVGPTAHGASSDVSLDLSTMFLALLVAVVTAGVGTGVVAADPADRGRSFGGGVFAGFGIAAAHYTGIAAMTATGTISYNAVFVLASVVMAVVAGVTVFRFAFEVDRTRTACGVSLVISGALCGMHYAALAATSVTVDPTADGETAVDPYALGVVTAVGSAIIMMLIVFAALSSTGEPGFTEARPGWPDRPDSSHRREDTVPLTIHERP